MSWAFAGLKAGTTCRAGGGRVGSSDRPVRVTVLTRGLAFALLTTAFAAWLAWDRREGPSAEETAGLATLNRGGGVVVALTFSPDGRSLAVVQAGEGVTIWDVASLEPRSILPTTSWVEGLAFSPDGKTLATADQGPTIRLWHADTAEMLGTLERPGYHFVWLAYSPDGRTLAASSWGESVMLWDVPTGRVQDTRRGRCDTARSLAFSPDGRTLAFAERGGSIVAWDVQRGCVRAELPGHASGVQRYSGTNTSLTFAPDGNLLASQGAFDPLVKLWDVESGRLLSTIDVEPSLGNVVSFSSGGTALILAAQGAVRERDIASRRSKTVVDGLSVRDPRLAVTRDTRTLAIAEGGLLTIRHRVPSLRKRGASTALVIRPGGRWEDAGP